MCVCEEVVSVKGLKVISYFISKTVSELVNKAVSQVSYDREADQKVLKNSNELDI